MTLLAALEPFAEIYSCNLKYRNNFNPRLFKTSGFRVFVVNDNAYRSITSYFTICLSFFTGW